MVEGVSRVNNRWDPQAAFTNWLDIPPGAVIRNVCTGQPQMKYKGTDFRCFAWQMIDCMKGIRIDDQNIAGFSRILDLADGIAQCPAADFGELHFLMPVNQYIVEMRGCRYAIKTYRKFRCSVKDVFLQVTVQIVHHNITLS